MTCEEAMKLQLEEPRRRVRVEVVRPHVRIKALDNGRVVFSTDYTLGWQERIMEALKTKRLDQVGGVRYED